MDSNTHPKETFDPGVFSTLQKLCVKEGGSFGPSTLFAFKTVIDTSVGNRRRKLLKPGKQAHHTFPKSEACLNRGLSTLQEIQTLGGVIELISDTHKRGACCKMLDWRSTPNIYVPNSLRRRVSTNSPISHLLLLSLVFTNILFILFFTTTRKHTRRSESVAWRTACHATVVVKYLTFPFPPNMMATIELLPEAKKAKLWECSVASEKCLRRFVLLRVWYPFPFAAFIKVVCFSTHPVSWTYFSDPSCRAAWHIPGGNYAMSCVSSMLNSFSKYVVFRTRHETGEKARITWHDE